jgi:Helix-turn-helix domain
MQVICLQEDAFYELLDRVVARIKDTHNIKEDKWISGEEAMRKLRITSRTTLIKMRDEGTIRYTSPEGRIVLYDSESINEYLDKHAQNTFS